jgi:hypothetical protein
LIRSIDALDLAMERHRLHAGRLLGDELVWGKPRALRAGVALAAARLY